MVEIGLIASIMALSWYWLVPIVIVMLITLIAFWNEEPLGSLGMLIVCGIVFYNVPTALTAIMENPIIILSGILVYVVIGFIWSVFKWYKKLISLRDNGVKNIPQASSFKGAIIIWASYWPIGMVRYVLGDLLEDLFTALWKRFNGVYQKIANKVFEVK